MQAPKNPAETLPPNRTPEGLPIDGITALARLTLGIALAALIALCASDAFAVDPPKKFEGDSKTFSNPFAAPPGGAGNPALFDEGDEEEDEGDDELDAALAQPPFRPGNVPGASGYPSRPQPSGGGMDNEGFGARGSVSVGGTGSGIVNRQEVSSLPVDSETGEGSRAVVTDFNFPDADIMDIAKALGKLTGKNFIFDKDVKGRVSIVSNSPITVGDAWKAFLTALDMNGFALIPSGKYIRLARNQDARDKQLRTFTGDYAPDTDALITRVMPLKYLNAQEVANTFRSFMPTRARILPYEQTNTIIVTDTGSNITKLAKLIEIMDIEGYDAGIEVIAVKHASATELAKLVEQLIPGTGTRPGATGAAASRYSGAGRFSARRTKEGGVINNIIADERTNTLIIHANAKGTDEVRALVTRLDQKLPMTAEGGKVNVVYLQFGDAEAIANTLNNLSQASGSRPAAAAPSAGGMSTGINPTQTTLFEGTIRVSADKATNALVVTASPNDFATVQRVISRLDIPRDQVHAEVVIMEISNTRGFDYSSNFVVPSAKMPFVPSLQTNGDLLNWAATPFAAAGGIISLPFGAKTTVNVAGKDVTVSSIYGLIKAIQTSSNANILATPQILTMDNQEATFETIDKIPVEGATTLTATGIAQSTPTKEPVTLSIKIKPQINRTTNMVTMKVVAKMTDISTNVPKSMEGRSIATTERNAETNVIVSDGDTVVLGGLTRDNVKESTNKIPILGDIPLLGWLFKSRTSSVSKTNMLIFITPRIIRPYEKVRAILDKKLKERDDFIEANMGGDDPNRRYRDQLIRDLPDVSTIGQKSASASDVLPAAVVIDPSLPPEEAITPASPSTTETDSQEPASTGDSVEVTD